MEFNLLVENWIPVLYTDGRFERVGIRKALSDAHRIRQLAASNPMDNVAVLRFLLALLYWCKGNPPDVMIDTSIAPLPTDWLLRLDANREYFDLLGPEKRFYQDRAAQRTRPVTDLIQEIPTGNNFWHLRHSTDYFDGLCPPCCAIGLLRLPQFSVSGLPNLKAGINGAPPIYVVRWGKSLSDTLRANWTAHPNFGIPAWVQPDIRPTPGEDVPLLTGLTVLSRRVWISDPVGPPGQCSVCGARKDTLIQTCEFETAGHLKNDRWGDPHVVYSKASPPTVSKAPDLTKTGKFSMDRPWLELYSQILQTGEFLLRDKPASLFVVAFATDQAKNIDVWEKHFNPPSGSSFRATAENEIQEWQKECRRLEKRTGETIRSEGLGKAAIAAIRPDVENRVSARAGELLAGDSNTWSEAATEYRPMMEMLAKSLSPGFTTAALHRRRQIDRISLQMGAKPESPKKPRSNKGTGK